MSEREYFEGPDEDGADDFDIEVEGMDDEGDPAEGWLGDSYFGAYDDDPSPYEGTYSEM